MPVEELELYLGDVLVGHLRQTSYRVSFSFSDEYLDAPARPVLGQWFEDRLHDGPFRERHGGLPAFFENLLPSDNLRLLIKVQHQLDEPTDMDFLAVVGEDLPGATVLCDPRQQSPVGFEDAPSVDLDGDREVGGLHFSLAGLQLKFSLVKQGHVLTLPVKGEHGHWIVKVPVMRELSGIVENEHAIMTWAAEAGFDVPHCEIVRAAQLRGLPHQIDDETAVFSIERFDRRGQERIHQEDLAQVLGVVSEDAVGSNVRFGYGGLGLIVGRLLGSSGLEEYFKRIALMVATGNEDAHIKNWSIIYRNGRTPSWSPIYDQVATIAWGSGKHRGPSLRMGSAREWWQVDAAAVDVLAREAGAEQVAAVVEETLLALRDTWTAMQDRSSMLPDHRRALVEHWERVPLLRRFGPLGA